MGDKKCLHVESKSFDLIREACNNGLCVIERGKNYMSTYEARILQKWSRTRTGYFLGTCSLGIFLHAYPRCTQIFQKKKSFSFIFSFGYITKIDKSSKSSGNMNFKCNYMDVHFFYLLFWILICNLKDHLIAMDIFYYP